MVNSVMTATARAVSACNSQNQDELVTAAALGKKMVDLLRGCKVRAHVGDDFYLNSCPQCSCKQCGVCVCGVCVCVCEHARMSVCVSVCWCVHMATVCHHHYTYRVLFIAGRAMYVYAYYP